MKPGFLAFVAAACLALPPPIHAQPAKRIAITFDDLPLQSSVPSTMAEIRDVNARLLRVLRARNVPAIGFVNEDKLQRPGEVDAGIAVLDAWLDAGMELGNHNYGHLGLWASSLQDVEDAVVRGDVVTRRLALARHAPLRYYRPPYTQTGRDDAEQQAFEAFLAGHGYLVAPFTIEHDDSVYACVFDRSPDAAGRAAVVRDYVAHLDVALDAFEAMSQELFGRQIPQILLIHDSRLNAQSLPATLDRLALRGYRFVSLEEALRDPAYRTPDHASRQYGPSWLARWARATHVKLSVYGQPDPVDGTSARAAGLCAEP
jgi:peptidoglycan/xylan/chitin deacetylase (PgdA/CDA1 family)